MRDALPDARTHGHDGEPHSRRDSRRHTHLRGGRRAAGRARCVFLLGGAARAKPRRNCSSLEVAQLGSTQIDCATSTFGALVPTSEMFVTTDSPVSMNSTFISVTKIIVPSGADQTKVCGNDIALLILSKPVTLPQYVTPVISPPMTDHSIYGTTVTAIGYGIDTPTDTQGASAGVRRIKENIQLLCIPNDSGFEDCLQATRMRRRF